MAKWFQSEIQLNAFQRGCHLITGKIERAIGNDLVQIKTGLCHIFIMHTSASLLINENCDQGVRQDMETFMRHAVPEGQNAPWTHIDEGTDDMPAHVKCAMFGVHLSIPIKDGKLKLGTWQGIWLCEHRDHASPRRLTVTLQGI